MSKKTVVIPVGDVAGVGPEIAVKALAHPEVYEWCRPVLVGEKSVLERALRITELPQQLHRIETVEEAKDCPGVIDYFDLHNIQAEEIVFGKVQAKAGRADRQTRSRRRRSTRRR